MSTKESFEYEDTLPQEPTDQLIEYLRHKLFNDKRLISTEHHDGYIYQVGTIHDPQTHLSYAFSPTEKMYDYYDSRLQSEEDDKYAVRNVNSNSYLGNIHDPTEYGLPDISLTDDELMIKTAEGEVSLSTIPRNDGDEVDVSNLYHVSVIGVTSDAFYLYIIEDTADPSDHSVLFATQDLTDIQVIEETNEAFEQFMTTDEFSLYADLFPPLDDDERYLRFYTSSNHRDQVIDTKEKTLIEIGEEDFLSKDGKYVYLSGKRPQTPRVGLAEGTQTIQTIDEYIAGTDTYELTFDLDFKAIQKAADITGIGTRVSESDREVVYFNEELLIIHVSYDAAITGKAGKTNVVIDFHEVKENPDIYILDLSGR